MTTVDVRTVATTLKVSLPSAYRLVRNGALPAVRVGKLWRVSKSSLERFLRGEQGPYVTPEAAGQEAA